MGKQKRVLSLLHRFSSTFRLEKMSKTENLDAVLILSEYILKFSVKFYGLENKRSKNNTI